MTGPADADRTGSQPPDAGPQLGAGADQAGSQPPRAPGRRPSGLGNPTAAVRGLGAGTLIIEAVVLLLAIQPIRILGGRLSAVGIAVVVALAVLAVIIAGNMRRRWAWHAGSALQIMLLGAGFLHWSLSALGLIFGAGWAYATHVRRTITG